MRLKLLIVVSCISAILAVSSSAAYAQELKAIKLLPPKTEGGMPLMNALKLRQSTRGNFGPEVKLSMQVLSNLLWAADGAVGCGAVCRNPRGISPQVGRGLPQNASSHGTQFAAHSAFLHGPPKT